VPWGPPQPEDIRETIAHLQFLIHEKFHPELVELSFPRRGRNALGVFHEELKASNEPPKPKPPRRPIHLLSRLRVYARELFDIEVTRRPQHAAPLNKMHDLVQRTESAVMGRVKEIGNLTYHATYEEMQGAIRAELEGSTGSAPVQQLESEIKPPKASPAGNKGDIADLLLRASLLLTNGQKEQIAQLEAIGVSRSTYFAIKGGHGSRRKRAIVEEYLKKFFSSRSIADSD
jgi:hypothetical protein